ncbi:MAG: hypothetical protein AAFQ19_15025 [Pseudomonadota bacterium]
MRPICGVFAALCALAACGDPLAGVERVSTGAPVPEQDAATALPTEAELAREDSILAGLFGRTDAEPPAAEDTASDESAEGAAPEGAAPETDTADLAEDTGAAPATEVIAAEAQADSPPRRGLVAWLRSAAEAERAPLVEADTPTETQTPPAETATATGPAADLPQTQRASLDVGPQPAPRRGGLFGGPARRSGPDAQDVPMGTRLPFGEIARVCDAKRRDLGKVVEHAAGKGRGYALHDSAPDSGVPRTFYITGFADNCPRQFTASLALFGTPAFHEQLRYGLPADQYPYSTTDKAYEKVKSRICNVGRNTPCGSRISRLERTTTFVSAYEHFKDNARWADMLLHDGEVLAKAVKKP